MRKPEMAKKTVTPFPPLKKRVWTQVLAMVPGDVEAVEIEPDVDVEEDDGEDGEAAEEVDGVEARSSEECRGCAGGGPVLIGRHCLDVKCSAGQSAQLPVERGAGAVRHPASALTPGMQVGAESVVNRRLKGLWCTTRVWAGAGKEDAASGSLSRYSAHTLAPHWRTPSRQTEGLNPWLRRQRCCSRLAVWTRR